LSSAVWKVHPLNGLIGEFAVHFQNETMCRQIYKNLYVYTVTVMHTVAKATVADYWGHHQQEY
jgi:hypothetical protein